MIKSIQLQNFQAHEDTLLELHPGVNVIAGSSNSGKSSILRALNWVIYNRPTGEEFVSHWARDKKGNQKDDASVVVDMGTVNITRRRSKTTGNTYTVGDKTLEAIGSNVPEEVSLALGFSEVNTQRQHDSPFLLSDSPGEVARFFNKIVHFDAIDRYLSSIESKKRKTRADAESNKNNAERLESTIASYAWMEDAEQLLSKIEALERKLEAIPDEELTRQLQEFRVNKERVDAWKSIINKADKLCMRIANKRPALAEQETQCQKVSEMLDAYKKYASVKTSSVDTVYAEKLIRKIERQRPLVSDLARQCEAIQESYEGYARAEQIRRESAPAIVELIKSLPSVCPTCGKEL